jgi:hypothetical protein
MSKKETTKPEVTKEVAKEGGDMKISKPKFKKFKSSKDKAFKVDLSKVDTSLEGNNKVEPPIKVDLTKTEDNAIPIGETETVDVGERAGDGKEMDSGGTTTVEEPSSPIEEVQEMAQESLQKEIKEPTVKVDLPENIEKLVDFMKETGGTIEDYTRLNADYTSVNDDALLTEYYKKSKPHLNEEEISFVMEENFKVDDEIDDQREIKKKNLAKKEAIAEARTYLEDLKGKYYDEIKLKSYDNPEQKKAMDFFNRYNKDQEVAKGKHERFVDDTKKHFTEDFKGFDFEVGEKKFRYGVKDPASVAQDQSNINNFVEKFLDNEGNVKDTKGYHKAIYAAQNVDRIVNHFYEQGKTDGIKTVMESSKNPTLGEPRQKRGDDIFVGGFKVRAIDGVDSSKLKIKRSKFNN